MWKTEREREVVELYSEDLRRLTFNSRPVISNLSELANEYRREFSHLIVKLIEDRIRQVPQDQKLPHLYLLDSIVKNHSEPYVILFQQNIVTTFALVFANSSYDDRKALLKLRNTWNNLFTFTKLNQLDKKIKTLDPAWPIQLPRRDQAAPAAPTKRIHVNPAVFGRSQPEPSAAEEELRKKALELERLRKEKEELEMLCKQRELDRELELARKQVEEQRALMTNGSSNKAVTISTRQPSPLKTTGKLEEKKARDPRVRAVNDDQSRSKTPESRAQGSPSRLGVPRTSKTPSPGRDRSDGKKSATPPPPPNIREDLKAKKTGKDRKRRRDDKKRTRDESSSPSPPPEREAVEPKKKFKIPKKKRSPSPEGFKIEGPQTEFAGNDGKLQKKTGGKKRRQGGDAQANDKKSKLAVEIFGNDVPQPLEEQPSPNSGLGWARFKEVNPDEFRIPMDAAAEASDVHQLDEAELEGFRGGRPRRQNFRRRNDNGQDALPFPPQPHVQSELAMLGASQPQLHAILQNPKQVVDQVVPNIIKQLQDLLSYGKIHSDQFSEGMRAAMQLKEQAHMKLADQRHNAIHPWQQNFNAAPPVMGQFGQGPPSRHHANRDLPTVSPQELDMIASDPIKRIDIDESPRDIRFYGETALVIMGPEAKDMRELMFQREGVRQVVFDQNVFVNVEIGAQNYTEFVLDDGVTHKVKIGAPTREIWIDGQWHELYFDKADDFMIGSTLHHVFLKGPRPSVEISKTPRNDLCAGSVKLIIDGTIQNSVTMFLDSKPQIVNIAGKPHVFRFVQGLKILLINGHPFKADFGGNPMVVYVNNCKHFLRLTSLPQGVKIGKVRLWNMDGNADERTPSPAQDPLPEAKPVQENENSGEPEQPQKEMTPPSTPPGTNENSQDGQSRTPFDRLLSLIPQEETEKEKEDHESSACSDSHYTTPMREPKPAEANEEGTAAATPKPNVDVHDLVFKLVGAGLLPSAPAGAIPGLDATPVRPNKDQVKPTSEEPVAKEASSVPEELPNAEPEPEVIVVLKTHHPSIKQRHPSVVNQIYDPTSFKCTNCGLRFSSSEMLAYSHHLDWHFRVKRREKDRAKRAESRQWYLPRIDWIKADEIEEEKEEEERSRSGSPTNDTAAVIPTVPVSDIKDDNICPICSEEFDSLYKQEDDSKDDEEGGVWHLKNAIRPDPNEEGVLPGRAYHPQCYRDRHNNLDDSNMTEQSLETSRTEEATADVKSEELETEHRDAELQPIKEEPMEKEPPEAPVQIKSEVVDDETGEDVKPDLDLKSENEPAEEAADEASEVKEEVKTEVKEEVAEMIESLDDGSHHELLMKPPVNPGGIVININKQPALERRESVRSTSESEDDGGEHKSPATRGPIGTLASEFDPDAIIQEVEGDPDTLKPKFKGRHLTTVPTRVKDKELSSLCSIM